MAKTKQRSGRDKTVLVTGGAGFIGSHTCKVLANSGFVPVVFDNLSAGHREAVRWGPLEVGDINDEARLTEVMERYRPVAVINFAALIAAGESVEDPQKYYLNNVVGCLSLLKAMRKCAIDTFIFSSTAAVYGIPQSTPIPENHPLGPINPYGASKLMIETVLKDYASAYGLKSVSLRYFNAAGADPDGELGEQHDPETHLIPLVLSAAMGERSEIVVYGDAYPTPDGTCIRDYVHVTDLARAHVLAMGWLESKPGAHVFNLGTGEGCSVREVLDTAQRVTGRTIQTRYGAPRPGDSPILVADATNARRELGWQPEYASIETQIEHAWAWHSSAAAAIDKSA